MIEWVFFFWRTHYTSCLRFASRLVAWILSRLMGASVGFRVGGWKCLRDVVVKFKKVLFFASVFKFLVYLASLLFLSHHCAFWRPYLYALNGFFSLRFLFCERFNKRCGILFEMYLLLALHSLAATSCISTMLAFHSWRLFVVTFPSICSFRVFIDKMILFSDPK